MLYDSLVARVTTALILLVEALAVLTQILAGLLDFVLRKKSGRSRPP